MPDASDLVAHARSTRVVVIGGGIGGLVAALECAKVGMPVTVVEADARLGGVVGSADFDGLAVDTGADSFAPRGTELRDLIEELGLADAVIDAPADARWISGLPDAARLPAEAVLSIPANPWSEETRSFIGWSGAWRAYLDRLRPPLTIGRERSLGALVRTRMGERVLDRMVAPVIRGLYGVDAHAIDVELAAPGLSTALTRTGSLAGAVSELSAAPRAPRASLTGGVHRLTDALAVRLQELDVVVRTGAPVTRLTRADDAWRVEVDTAEGESEQLDAEVVVIATDETAARALMAPLVDLPRGIDPAQVDVVTLRVTAPAPVSIRTEVYPLDGAALRVVDATATWPWLADAVGPSERVVRVMLPPTGDADDAVIGAARDAAAKALGWTLDPADVRTAHRRTCAWAPPSSLLGQVEAAAAVRAAALEAGLALTGAWIAGSGIAAVTADAVAEAARVRRRALWGGEPAH